MSYVVTGYVADGYVADSGGTLFWVVYAAAGATPTAAQVASGKDATGATALASGVELYTGAGTIDEQTAISSLSAGTAYKVAWVAYDGTNYSNVSESASITTLPSVAVATTGGSGIFTGTAGASSDAALAATGDSGIFAATANSPATATLAVTGGSGTFSGAASTGTAAIVEITGGSGTASFDASVPAAAHLAALGGEGAFAGSAYPLTAAEVAALGGSGTFAGTASVSSGGTGATAEEIVTALMAHEIEPGVSVQFALRVILAAVSGPTAGVGTSTERYYDPDGLVARITATFDGDSNRTSVTLDGS